MSTDPRCSMIPQKLCHEDSVEPLRMKAWRDSASLIMAARQGRRLNNSPSRAAFQYDYKLLNLKRHQDATFLPGTYVFPGGTFEPSDADLKWSRLFSTFGFDTSSYASLFTTSSSRPPIFKSRRNELPREISLRITAIRETFEECGILLCRKSPKKGILTEWAEHIAVEDMDNWQERVHGDATEFFRMCQGLRCYPDIWALHEWSNWMTPTFKAKRFDTIFYLACMETQPETQFESKEMEDLKWEDPQAILCPSTGLVTMLSPPQHYEIGRIAKFECLDNLLDFAASRGKRGVHLNIPVKVKLADGEAHLLPGDSMYPEDVSLTDRQVLDRTHLTIAEYRDMSPVKNRMESYSLNVRTLVVNVSDNVDGHLAPFPLETVQVKPTK